MCFAECHLGDWQLEPGRHHLVRYRYVVHDGPVQKEEADRLWFDFAHPPQAVVEQGESNSRVDGGSLQTGLPANRRLRRKHETSHEHRPNRRAGLLTPPCERYLTHHASRKNLANVIADGAL